MNDHVVLVNALLEVDFKQRTNNAIDTRAKTLSTDLAVVDADGYKQGLWKISAVASSDIQPRFRLANIWAG